MAKVITFPTRTAADVCSSSTTQFHLEIGDESPPSNDTKFSCLYDFALDEDLWNSIDASSNTPDTRKSDLEGNLETFLCSTVTLSDNSLLDLLEASNKENEESGVPSNAFDFELSSTNEEIPNQSLHNKPSLSSLAKDHFKCIENGEYESDSVIDIDDLADLLTSTCIADCKTSKSLESKPVSIEKAAVQNNSCVSGDISLTDLLAIAEDEPKIVSAGSFGKESCLGDELGDLLGISKSSNVSDVSLAALAEIHFVNSQSEKSCQSTDTNFDSLFSDCSSGSSYKTSESIDDLHSGQKLENAKFDDTVSLMDILRAVNTNEETNISNYINDLNDCVKEKSMGIIAKEVKIDDEQTPDIDLNICVKSRPAYNSNVQLPLPMKEESIDKIDCLLHKGKTSSGYIPDSKITNFSNASVINKEVLERQKETKVNLNQSLFGKALSCKSKPNKSRTEKVSKIRSEMLQQLCMPVKVDSHLQKPEIIRKVVDLSDQCILPTLTGRFVFSVTSCGVQ